MFNFDGILTEHSWIEHLNASVKGKKCIVTMDELPAYTTGNVKVVLYGFTDEFRAIEAQILEYYDIHSQQLTQTVKAVAGDIVMLGDSEDHTLKAIRSMKKTRKTKILEEQKSLKILLKGIEEHVCKVADELGEGEVLGKRVPGYVFDNVFEVLFHCGAQKNTLNKSISRLHSLKYNNCNLASQYAQYISGAQIRIAPISIEKYEWEKAKMLIEMLDPDKVSVNQLKQYVDALRNHCSTGKEYYVKALVSPESKKGDLLQNSFDRGYAPAGDLLLERYKNGKGKVNIRTLANALVPEACMIVAERQMRTNKSRRRFVDLDDEEFTFYKIAAARQYEPAIGKIVQIVYESRFGTAFQIPEDNLDEKKYEEMIEHGHVVCQLCRYLINKRYHADHYREIFGVVLFCLNENLSESMNLLSGIDTAVSNYCKGNMFEFGGGVSSDLDLAIEYYERAIAQGFSGKVQRRLEACYGKRNRYNYSQNNDNNYNENNSYSSSSTTKSSKTVDDGCFTPDTRILMANGELKSVSEIKCSDIVAVYDHYSGHIGTEEIVANVHESMDEQLCTILELQFDNGTSLRIVKSHALFCVSLNKYVLLDETNVKSFVGYQFAYYNDSAINPVVLINCKIESKVTRYFVPISKKHLNVFAEGLLTMPPTKLTTNMFDIGVDMKYDLSVVENMGETSYDKLKELVSLTEYEDLPCIYLEAVLTKNECVVEDFIEILKLYREQYKYLEI